MLKCRGTEDTSDAKNQSSDRSWFVSLKARERSVEDDRTQCQLQHTTGDCVQGGNAKAIVAKFGLESFSSSSPVVLPPDVESQLMGDFGIGLIMGPSGSGKSTVLKRYFKNVTHKPLWCNDRAVVSHFETPDEGICALQSVGLNTIPAWLRPYETLSTGERARADLARRLTQGMIVEDEFTSTLDRRTAISVSVAVSRHCRAHQIKRAIFASCHDDVAHALQPDWVLWMPQGKFIRNEPRLDGSYHRGIEIRLDTSPARAGMQDRWTPNYGVTIGERRAVHCKVVVDEHARVAAQVMEINFYGESVAKVPTLTSGSHFAKPGNFGIGLIVGPSGSGKSSLLKQFGITPIPEWKSSAPLIDHFASSDDGHERLCAVGLTNPKVWLRPYSVLSTGEQHRADIARILASGVCIDEFTSTLDRTVAKHVASAISALCRKRSWSGLVFAACHADIGDYLQADWVHDTLSCSFKVVSPTPVDTKETIEAEFANDQEEIGLPTELDSDEELYNLCVEQGLLRQNQIEAILNPAHTPPPEPQSLFSPRVLTVRVQRCGRDVWPRFSPHHYLSPFLAPGSMCFVAVVNDNSCPKETAPFDLNSAVAFVACKPIELPMPNMYGRPAPNGAFRESRLVVIPELQGLGLGKLLSEGVAQLFIDRSIRYMSKAAHPRVAYRDYSKLWRPAPDNGQLSYTAWDGTVLPHPRRCYNHEYVGVASPVIVGAQDDDSRTNRVEQHGDRVCGSCKVGNRRSRSPKRSTTALLDEVERFLSEAPSIKAKAVAQLKSMPVLAQRAVLGQGSLIGVRDATAVLDNRIRAACLAYTNCMKFRDLFKKSNFSAAKLF